MEKLEVICAVLLYDRGDSFRVEFCVVSLGNAFPKFIFGEISEEFAHDVICEFLIRHICKYRKWLINLRDLDRNIKTSVR